ncbi:thioesterase family protein [Ascidiimonas aurantiaca]|uniref:acyl-CoA thioesterase n=1 Tax=Ascidiimonas aurantiaca TaxID=1685432 RepID=UPI0030EE7BD5
MNVYEKQIMVTEAHLDAMQHVNNVTYLQWVQDVARDHWEHLISEEERTKYAWVVLDHFIEYKQSALLGDTVLVRTYVAGSQGATSVRIVEMYRGDGEILLAKAKTTWCLLNRENLRPARIPEKIMHFFAS